MPLRDVLKVLVVDDMSTSRGILLQTLDALGLTQVSHAVDGRAGLSRVRSERPHLVISDLYMPELNGLQLLQQIRHDPSIATTAFILVSGRCSGDIAATGRRLGLNNILAKPYTAPQLRQAVEAVVGRL